MAQDPTLKNAKVADGAFPRSFGKYVLERSLSRGGMGQVYLAIAKGLKRRCVIKTIRTDLLGEEEFVGRFTDEAKIMVRLNHANIIRVFDAGKVRDDYYIAMEYAHGRDLGDVLDRAYERGEPMPTQLGLYISSQLMQGLDAVHSLKDENGRDMGLVHRDVSPQNVLLGFDGSIKLIDFGLARSELLPGRTQGALAIGKYGYMSPEQARHETIDGRADIYSAGVLLFEVFTGDRLVDEQDKETLWQRVLNPKHRKPSDALPSLPKGVDELIGRAVQTETSARFQNARSMQAFADRLRGKDSHQDALIRYLHYLYPRVDFSEPDIPQYSEELDSVEKSMVIALSREGAKSVFGRGELPIEWTMEFDHKNLRPDEPEATVEHAVFTETPTPFGETRTQMETLYEGPPKAVPASQDLDETIHERRPSAQLADFMGDDAETVMMQSVESRDTREMPRPLVHDAKTEASAPADASGRWTPVMLVATVLGLVVATLAWWWLRR